MKMSNFDFWILAAIVSTIAGIGIFECTQLHPVFYSQPIIIFGALGYFAYKGFYLDLKCESKNEHAEGT